MQRLSAFHAHMSIVHATFNTVPVSCVNETDQHGNLIMRLNDIGLDAYVRYKRYDDGVRLAEIDVVKAVTGKNKEYAGQILRRMSGEVQDELRANCTEYNFNGKGERKTTLITFQGALKLIMALPGINARDLRTKFADVLQRYFAGDPSLVSELIDNNQSAAPINSVARDDLGVPQVGAPGMSREEVLEMLQQRSLETYESFKKRRRLELNDRRCVQLHELKLKDKDIAILKETQVTEKVKQDTIEKETEAKTKIIEKETEAKIKTLTLENEGKRMEIEILKLKQAPVVNVNVTNTQPVPSSDRVTVEQIADTFGLLHAVPDVHLRRRALNVAGSRLARPPYNLAPAGKRESRFSDRFNVNEYSGAYTEMIKEVIQRAAADVVRQMQGQTTLDSFRAFPSP